MYIILYIRSWTYPISIAGEHVTLVCATAAGRAFREEGAHVRDLIQTIRDAQLLMILWRYTVSNLDFLSDLHRDL